MEKGGYLSRDKGAMILNTVIKRPLSGPVDYVALERGDRTATKLVFPADTGKTDHQKDRIILSLLHKFPGMAYAGFFRMVRESGRLEDSFFYFTRACLENKSSTKRK